MKKLFLTLLAVLFLAGTAYAERLIWEKPILFPDEANGGYTIRFWSTDGTDRTETVPYVDSITGADTLEYDIDGLRLLYDLEYTFQVWAYNSMGESDGSNTVTYVRAAPTYIPPENDLPVHIQIVNPGNVNIQIINQVVKAP